MTAARGAAPSYPPRVVVLAGRRRDRAARRRPRGQVIVTPPPSGRSAGPAAAPAPPPPGRPAPAAGRDGPASRRPRRSRRPGLRPGHGVRHPVAPTPRTGCASVSSAATSSSPSTQDGAFQDRNTFFVLRPIMAGNFFKEWIHFWTSFEFAANPPYLLDSYVELAPWKEFGAPHRSAVHPCSIATSTSGRRRSCSPSGRRSASTSGPAATRASPPWGRSPGSSSTGRASTPARRCGSSTPCRATTSLEARVTWNPHGPHGRHRVPVHRRPRSRAVPRVGDAAGLLRQVQSATENFNPSTFRFETMADAARPTRQAAGSADFWLQGRCFTFYRRRLRPAHEPAMARVVHVGRRLGPGRRACSSPRRWTSRTRINWLNPSIDLANDRFYSLEGSSRIRLALAGPGPEASVRVTATRIRPAWPRSATSRSSPRRAAPSSQRCSSTSRSDVGCSRADEFDAPSGRGAILEPN